MIRVEHADMLQAIPRLVAEGVAVDAVVTDPPYHLTPTLKRFGATGSAPAQHGRDGAMARLSRGFMGQQWDGGDIAFRPETWATVATIMRPGAFLVAFGGTRTHHRLWSAIEDAGFVIQDTIMWLFATGFPKRRDMLKPAYEPICLAYKPGGTRTMQIDECRIACDDKTPFPLGATSADGSIKTGLHGRPRGGDSHVSGRWPANICHDGSDEVIAAFPQSAGQLRAVRGTEIRRQGTTFKAMPDPAAFTARGDSGSAARFFFSAKADAQDRCGSRHPTVKPVELISWLVRLVTPPGGVFLDPFAGSGTAASAALNTGRDAILIEREAQYVVDIERRIKEANGPPFAAAD